MTAKLIAIAFITVLVLVAVGVVNFFFLMIGMNGFHEREANVVFLAYFVIAALTLIASAAASGWGAGTLARKANWPLWVAGPLAIVVVSVVGGIALVLGGLIVLTVATV